MSEYSKPLTNEEWSEHYNLEGLDNVLKSIENENVSIWTKELIEICEVGASVLEIGCGTGISSLWLAKNDRKVTALDYTRSSVELVKTAAAQLNIQNIDVVHCDATRELPFKENQFDYVFQAGLLEHFDTEEQIRLLTNWRKHGKYMISMIPNASSIPYRVGKKIMEENNTWEYGLEVPKHSMAEEFTKAGIKVIREYTIGTEWACRFLPKKHYIKKLFEKLKKQGYNLDEYMQGYLLVTVGIC